VNNFLNLKNLVLDKILLKGGEIVWQMFLKSRIPSSPNFIRGVINLRDKIIPILNLKSLFNLEQLGDFETAKINHLYSQEDRLIT